ncbi:MAG: NAD-dependent epimerase/dehydratase family protein [Polyangiales bacterium]
MIETRSDEAPSQQGAVLVAGCGAVGSSLASLLSAQGFEVWGLRRSIEHLPPHVRGWRADLGDAKTLQNPPAKFRTLFYTAAADSRAVDAYNRAYIEGVQNLRNAIGLDGHLHRAFFSSSTSVYAQDDGSNIDERSETEPESIYGRIMLDAETRFRATFTNATVVRFSGIYGPGRWRLIQNALEGRESESRFTNRIHVHDCANVFAHLSSQPYEHDTYLASDLDPAPMTEVVQFLRSELNKNGAIPVLSPTTPRPEEPRRGKRCQSTRLTDSGFRFRYPSYREGYPSIVKEFVQSVATTSARL